MAVVLGEDVKQQPLALLGVVRAPWQTTAHLDHQPVGQELQTVDGSREPAVCPAKQGEGSNSDM